MTAEGAHHAADHAGLISRARADVDAGIVMAQDVVCGDVGGKR